MKKIAGAIVFILTALLAFGQKNEGVVYFRMPILVEDEPQPAQAFVSANFFSIDSVSLKKYSGNDAEISKLSQLVDALSANNKAKYLELSEKADTMSANFFEFYKMLLSHTDDPRLFYKAEVGNYKLFFVWLHRGYPMLVFCLHDNGASLLNNPQVVMHPAIIGLIEAINKSYLFPSQFKPQGNPPSTNTTVKFDSAFGNPSKGLAYYLNVAKVKFNIADINDTGNAFDVKYKPVLSLYRQTIDDLDSFGLEKYYTYFSPQSKDRIVKAFLRPDASTPENIDYFKGYKTNYGWVVDIVDFGAVNVLFASPEIGAGTGMIHMYSQQSDGRLRWVNEYSLFYFDDLIKTEEFKRALY